MLSQDDDTVANDDGLDQGTSADNQVVDEDTSAWSQLVDTSHEVGDTISHHGENEYRGEEETTSMDGISSLSDDDVAEVAAFMETYEGDALLQQFATEDEKQVVKEWLEIEGIKFDPEEVDLLEREKQFTGELSSDRIRKRKHAIDVAADKVFSKKDSVNKEIFKRLGKTNPRRVVEFFNGRYTNIFSANILNAHFGKPLESSSAHVRKQKERKQNRDRKKLAKQEREAIENWGYQLTTDDALALLDEEDSEMPLAEQIRGIEDDVSATGHSMSQLD